MTIPAVPSIDELSKSYATLLQQSLLEAETEGVELSTADLAIARSNTKALAFVQAVGINGAYNYLRKFIAPQAIPTKSSGTFLDEWLLAYGLPRKGGKPATGLAIGIGPAGAILKAGSVFTHVKNGYNYLLLSDAAADEEGNVSFSLQCEMAGTAGNLLAGENLTLVTEDTDFDSVAVVDDDGISGGTDMESPAEAVYRLHHRLANPPRGSSPTDYERWAMMVPGITRAYAIRNPAGPTTMGVIIFADNNPDLLPTEAQRQAVYDFIRDQDRGPPDELFVIIPTPKYTDIRAIIEPDTQTIRKGILLELGDLFFRNSEPGGRMPISHINEAISIAPGEYNHTLIEPEPVPGGFIFATTYEFLALGRAIFTTAAEEQTRLAEQQAAQEIVSGGGDG